MLTFGKIQESKKKPGIRTCIICNEVKKIVGKDMCQKCYDKSRLETRRERYHSDENYRRKTIEHAKKHQKKMAPLLRVKRILRVRTDEQRERARERERERRKLKNKIQKQ